MILGNKILILGSTGAGKTTFAIELGKLLNLEVIHLDSFYWNKNWEPTPSNEWKIKLSKLLQKDKWIIDGNYITILELRLKDADSVIFIDFPLSTCLWRCFKRYILHLGKVRAEMPEGCVEKFDWEFIKWIWNYPRDICPKILEILEKEKSKKIIILQNKNDVSEFLKKNLTQM